MGGGFSCCNRTAPDAIAPGAVLPLLPSSQRGGEGNGAPGSDSLRALAERILSESNSGGRNSDRSYRPSINANQSDSDESLGVTEQPVVRSTSREGMMDVIDPRSAEEALARRQREVAEKANKEFLEQRAQRSSAEALAFPGVSSSRKRPLSDCFQLCSTRNLIGILLNEEIKLRQEILDKYYNSWKEELPLMADNLLIQIFSPPSEKVSPRSISSMVSEIFKDRLSVFA